MTYTTYQGTALTYYTMTPEPIFGATATIIAQDGHGLLIDSQFSNADADNIVQVAKQHQITIETIYLSYSDPDYYFGTFRIKEAFPDAKVVATASTIDRIKQTYADKLVVWKGVLGDERPQEIIIPAPIEQPLSVADQTLTIIGKDRQKQTVYSEADKLLLGGILVAADSHLFMADTKTVAAQRQWIEDLDELIELKPNVVIPEHFAAGNRFSPDNLTFTKRYIERFIKAEQGATTSDEIIQEMRAAYPHLADGSLEMSAKVVTGEQAWD